VSATAPDLAGVGPIRASFGPDGDLDGISLLLVRFSDAVDQRSSADAAAQFTEDGLFQPGIDPVRGRSQIEALYQRRFSDERRRTCHLWSNLQVHPAGPSEAGLKVVLTNYAFEPAISEETLQFRIGTVSGRCVKDGQGVWRFAEHLYERTFTSCLPVVPAR